MRYFYRSKIKEVIYKTHGQLTPDEIASLTGVDRTTIIKLMGDKLLRRLDMNVLEPLANWLKCEPEELYEIIKFDDLSTKEQRVRYFYRSKLKEVIYARYGKVTHEQIAALTGMNRPTITKWMGDRLFRRLDMDILEPIANWLDCRPEDLYEIVEVDDLPEEKPAP